MLDIYKPYISYDIANQLAIAACLKKFNKLHGDIPDIMSQIFKGHLFVKKHAEGYNCIGFKDQNIESCDLFDPHIIYDKRLHKLLDYQWDARVGNRWVKDMAIPFEKGWTLKMETGPTDFRKANEFFLSQEPFKDKILFSVVRSDNERAAKFTEFFGFKRACMVRPYYEGHHEGYYLIYFVREP